MCKTTPTILIPALALLACPISQGREEVVPRAIPVGEAETAAEAAHAAEAPVEARHVQAGRTFGEVATSESGQFRVRGGDGALRGSVAQLADHVRRDFLRLIGELDAEPDYDVPVHIRLVGAPGDELPPRTISKSITHHAGEFDLRVNVHIGRGLDVPRFENAITAALVHERGIASQPDADADTPLFVPPWLVEGLREAIRWRSGNANRRLYESLFQSGGLFGADELFRMSVADHEALDAATRAAFQASSGALVMALLEQPDGRAAFRGFLGEVARFEGEMPALLRSRFPDLNLSENSLEKWWALQLASRGAARLTESLDIFESEKHLEDALRLRFRDGQGEMREVPITDWEELADLDRTDRIQAVRVSEDALVHLSYRCFPTYRPLLVSYQDALNRIARGDAGAEELATRLDELAETRANMIDKADRGRDYMDWFEITRARQTSGAFDDYLRLKQQLREAPRATRNDPASDLLDRFDAIFHRDTGGRREHDSHGWAGHNPPILRINR